MFCHLSANRCICCVWYQGPDGTNGFVTGWTKRVSEYVVVPESEDEIAQAVDTPDETALADVDSTLEAV